MRVLITGANGMLATNLIEDLLSKGYIVRGLLRDKRRYGGVTHPELELMEGDFTNYQTAKSAVEGCDYIIHGAAITAQNITSYDIYKSVNVDATTQLLNIAIERGVTRFVYVSSANTIGYGTPSNPADESLPMISPYSDSMYVKSKYEAEREVLALSDKLDVVVVNPTFMIGKYGDDKGSNRIFKMARCVTLCPKGGRNFIDVTEAARGVVEAMLRGRCGERYLICSENLSYKSFFEMIPGVRQTLYTPNWLLRIMGVVGEVLRLCGVPTDLSRANMKMLSLNVGYSGAKAQRELNFTPKGISIEKIFDEV